MKQDRPNILVIQADNPGYREVLHVLRGLIEQHCLRADKGYSNWAYQDIIDYRFPEE